MGVTWRTGQGPETMLPVPRPRSYMQILTHDFVQHQVKTAAEGSIETHSHRDRHVTQGFSQTATVDIILCQDVWGGKGKLSQGDWLGATFPPPMYPPCLQPCSGPSFLPPESPR